MNLRKNHLIRVMFLGDPVKDHWFFRRGVEFTPGQGGLRSGRALQFGIQLRESWLIMGGKLEPDCSWGCDLVYSLTGGTM